MSFSNSNPRAARSFQSMTAFRGISTVAAIDDGSEVVLVASNAEQLERMCERLLPDHHMTSGMFQDVVIISAKSWAEPAEKLDEPKEVSP